MLHKKIIDEHMVLVDKNEVEGVNDFISREVPLIIVKNYVDKKTCRDVVNSCHTFTKTHKPILGDIYRETFYQVDFLPSKVQTDRILRSFHFSNENGLERLKGIKSLFSLLEKFQSQYTCSDNKLPKGFSRLWQIINYPVGGGYFDWHDHPRYPVNYGLVLNLSEKNVDFNKGQTEFKIGGKIISIDDYATIGDLILFKFDLEHRVAPCDPDQDILFSSNGRWTAVLPILKIPDNPGFEISK